jgi:hypothetical protein
MTATVPILPEHFPGRVAVTGDPRCHTGIDLDWRIQRRHLAAFMDHWATQGVREADDLRRAAHALRAEVGIVEAFRPLARWFRMPEEDVAQWDVSVMLEQAAHLLPSDGFTLPDFPMEWDIQWDQMPTTTDLDALRLVTVSPAGHVVRVGLQWQSVGDDRHLAYGLTTYTPAGRPLLRQPMRTAPIDAGHPWDAWFDWLVAHTVATHLHQIGKMAGGARHHLRPSWLPWSDHAPAS